MLPEVDLSAYITKIRRGFCASLYTITLKSGIEKYNNGETMTEEEYNAVKNFNEWSDKQGEKTYDEWDQ